MGPDVFIYDRVGVEGSDDGSVEVTDPDRPVDGSVEVTDSDRTVDGSVEVTDPNRPVY